MGDVDVEDDGLDLHAEIEHLLRVLDHARPGHLRDVHEALDALLGLDEGAVILEADDLALHHRTGDVLLLGVGPRIIRDLLGPRLTRSLSLLI